MSAAKVNPEWEALDGKPPGVLLMDSDAFRCVKAGLPPGEKCLECDGKGQVDNGGVTPWGGYYHDACRICRGRGWLTPEEAAALRNPQPATPNPNPQ